MIRNRDVLAAQLEARERYVLHLERSHAMEQEDQSCAECAVLVARLRTANAQGRHTPQGDTR